MIRLTTLDNGVRVAMDRMTGVRSCALGVWLEVGSRLERGPELGLTHFIEHMLFKGTPRFNAIELSDELNRMGGHVNAHTSQEAICLHAHAVDTKSAGTLDLLSEMMIESTFPREEIKRERNVILEEYRMYEDDPEDRVMDLFFETLWPKSPLGRPVIGEPRTIKKFSRDLIDTYLAREFDPRRLLIVMAGSFDVKECMGVVRKRFGSIRVRKASKKISMGETRPKSSRRLVGRDVEQSHFCFGTSGPVRGSQDRYAFTLMNMILGGGMSSRLFKEVREKRGLAYSIQSFAQPFNGAGSFGVAGTTSPATLSEVLGLCYQEIERICNEVVPKDELVLAREQIVDSILMGMESTSARMGRLSESIMTFGRTTRSEEVVRRIRAVKPEEIRTVANKYLKGSPLAGALVGPKGSSLKIFREKIA